MTIYPLEPTTCYKCDCELMARVGEVHPLCVDCQESFDDWFERQLTVFKN